MLFRQRLSHGQKPFFMKFILNNYVILAVEIVNGNMNGIYKIVNRKSSK